MSETMTPVLVSEGRGGALRAHRMTCKRAGADAFETLPSTAVKLHHVVPATCCKPQLPAPFPPGQPVVCENHVALTDPALRVEAAKKEHRMLQAWIKDGEKPPRPETPNLDAMNAEYAAGVTAKGRRATVKGSSKARQAPAQPIQFTKNGHPMNRSNNSLSSLAWQGTAKIGGPEVKRISTDQLRAMLIAAGVDLTSTSWTFQLPNGVTIGCQPLAAAS